MAAPSGADGEVLIKGFQPTLWAAPVGARIARPSPRNDPSGTAYGRASSPQRGAGWGGCHPPAIAIWRGTGATRCKKTRKREILRRCAPQDDNNFVILSETKCSEESRACAQPTDAICTTHPASPQRRAGWGGCSLLPLARAVTRALHLRRAGCTSRGHTQRQNRLCAVPSLVPRISFGGFPPKDAGTGDSARPAAAVGRGKRGD